jgi:hypothetical protein
MYWLERIVLYRADRVIRSHGARAGSKRIKNTLVREKMFSLALGPMLFALSYSASAQQPTKSPPYRRAASYHG